MRPIQGIFEPDDYPDLLVGLGQPDDAAVWRLDDERALVVTTDFFTPVVDDPYDYGAIAAANALSDVYAMGGRPFLALNIAALPAKLPGEIGAEIMRGGAEKVREAGAVLAGGHTIQDEEPKYGLIAVGYVNPDHMLTKDRASPGEVLMLSKPLGFGTATTALKRGLASAEDIAEAVSWMKRLNKVPSELAQQHGVRAGTDITGFSLLGHAAEMAQASGVGLRFSLERIPLIDCARRFADDFVFPGGTSDNRLYFSEQVRFSAGIDEPSQMLLFDAQTSGGLLLSVPAENAAAMQRRARETDHPLWIVGEVTAGSGIEVVP
jgi:selenide,water dikinase